MFEPIVSDAGYLAGFVYPLISQRYEILSLSAGNRGRGR